MNPAPAHPFRVAFVNPPFLPDYSRGQRSPAVTRSGTIYYPIWLAYAAAWARGQGHQVLLHDAVAARRTEEESLNEVCTFSPDVVLVEGATPSLDNDLAFATRLKERRPAARVFAVGTHVSALPEPALAQAPTLDGVIVGEFEVPLREILAALAAGRPLAGLEGVAVPGHPAAPRREFLEDLDALPFVSEIYRDFLPIDRYFNPNAHHPMVTILTGRGCPFHCSFCVFPQTLTGHAYRRRSIDSVLDEFRWVATNLPQVRGIFIEDDTFTADQSRVREFAARLQALHLPLSWTANARADVDYETLVAMRDSGLRALCVGFESGSQALLDRAGKGNTLATMEEFARQARRAGVKIHGCFMVGLPGESKATMQETLQFALRLPLDTAQFYPLMVYPGTRAYREAEAAGHLVARTWRDWLSPEGLHQCVVRTADAGPATLVRFCNFARRRFYLRKSYLWYTLGRLLTDAGERHRILRSARTFLGHLFRDA
ncbi:MAG: radical SAM protein [Candidatus Riflebacteria bacterium]|nr:radical SAM protein [Candidatus Riflebacteria bacterium]